MNMILSHYVNKRYLSLWFFLKNTTIGKSETMQYLYGIFGIVYSLDSCLFHIECIYREKKRETKFNENVSCVSLVQYSSFHFKIPLHTNLLKELQDNIKQQLTMRKYKLTK